MNEQDLPDDGWKPRVLGLGHWKQRTMDTCNLLNERKVADCVAAVTDMQDALIVLRSAIPPIELLLCSSYFSLADVQEALTAYDGELLVMVAVPGLMNTGGAPAVIEWFAECVAARRFHPKDPKASKLYTPWLPESRPPNPPPPPSNF